MSERNMSIVFSSRLSNITEYNSSFDTGVLQVCYVGRNRNNSFISKETFERCIKSIYNCPIVCRYIRETNEIGAHDMELVKRDDGSLKLVNITHPIGVIPESAKYWWTEVEEDDGSIHEYLCVDALLWKRQEAYEKIKSDGVTDESMEISIKEGRMVDGVYIIERFEFVAFCLLGIAEPCYESASLLMFSHEEFKSQLDEMMRDFKDSVSKMQFSEEVDIHNQNDLEGGEKTLSTKNLTPEEFALVMQFTDELIAALSVETIETAWGKMARYWFVDYSDEVLEVYCYDAEDWKLYGFTYSMNGDNVKVDFNSKKRMKFSIVDFDEGEQTAAFSAVYSLFAEQYAANDKQWAEKYQLATDNVATIEGELSDLRKYKADAERVANDAARNKVFAEFEDLAGTEAFEALRENCEQYTPDDLLEKCFAIRGKSLAGKFSLMEQGAPRILVERKSFDESNEPYGGVFSKYGIYRKQ